jgi:23S rRNA-/tRNA-specific pseudouridylate synthase
MGSRNFRIKQHLYNGAHSKGSIFVNDILLQYFPSKESEKFVKGFVRSFADNGQLKVSVEISNLEVFDNEKLAELLDQVVTDVTYLQNPDNKMSAPDKLKYFTIIYEDNDYLVPLESDIGKSILGEIKFSDFAKMSNEDVVKLIEF